MTRPERSQPVVSRRADPLAYDTNVEFALLDAEGVIVAVNDAWLAFCRRNGGDVDRCGVGVSYLDICDGAADEGSQHVGAAIRAAIAGERPSAVVTTISCDAPDVPRRFDVLVSSRLDDEGRCVGATVALSLVTDRRATTTRSSTQTEKTTLDADAYAESLLAVMNDRERIAGQLNSQVMSKLLSAGMGLQGMVGRLGSPEDKAQLARYVEDLDAIVYQVRGAVFDLASAGIRGVGLKHRLLEAIDDERQPRSINISIGFSGPLDTDIGGDLGDLVLHVVQSAVASVVRSSSTSAVDVSLALADSLLVVEVAEGGSADNSPALDADFSRVAAYAAQAGGELQVTTGPTGQTLLRWIVPCHSIWHSPPRPLPCQ